MKTRVNYPVFMKPFERFLMDGKGVKFLPGRIHCAYVKTPDGKIRFFGVTEWSGDKIFFFPAFHDGIRSSIIDGRRFAVHHVTLDKNRTDWHISDYTNGKKVQAPIRHFKTNSSKNNNYYWFGIGINDYTVFPEVDDSNQTYFNFRNVSNEFYTSAIDSMQKAQDDVVFNQLEMPTGIEWTNKSSLCFEIFISKKPYDEFIWNGNVQPFPTPPKGIDYNLKGHPLRTHEFKIPENDERLIVVTSIVPWKSPSNIDFHFSERIIN